ncbi:MAG: hypothetical protein QXG44_13520 [Candidatus Jordarchaeaceae archaeon]
MSSVKIDRKTKEKLERFLASVLLDKGVKMSQKEALARMIDFALKRKEEFLESNLPPLEEDYAWKMPNKPKSWGVKDASEKIDESLHKGS